MIKLACWARLNVKYDHSPWSDLLPSGTAASYVKDLDAVLQVDGGYSHKSPQCEACFMGWDKENCS